MSRDRSSKALLASLLAFTGAWALAQAPAPERALAKSSQEVREWAPCPPFMPAGCGLAVLHGDPAKPNADVFLRVPGGAVIPEHRHTSAERMILVAGELHVAYKGQPKVVLKPGMYAYGPAELSHSASCIGSGPCVLFIAFESAVDAVPTEAAQ
jgi:quercetin dioxygenase-like cupin family protein